jgi:hypothetical protein
VTSSSIVDRRRLGARQHHTPVWVRQACRSWVAGGRFGRPKSSTTQTVTASGNQLLLLLLLLHLLRGRGRRGDGAWQGPVTGRASGRGRGRCSLCGSRWARRGFSISACQGPSGSLVQKGIPVLCLAWRVRRALAPVANCTPPWALGICWLLLSPEERAESTSRTARTSLATDRKCRLCSIRINPWKGSRSVSLPPGARRLLRPALCLRQPSSSLVFQPPPQMLVEVVK